MITLNIQADQLYKSLRDIGGLERTFEVQELTVTRDIVTGKVRKKSHTQKYAPIRVIVDGRAMVVDHDLLTRFVKSAKRGSLELVLIQSIGLICRSGKCECTLFELLATPGGEINIDELSNIPIGRKTSLA